VAIGDPGVIDVIDIGTMRCEEVVPTEAGAHTLALDRNRSKIYSFLPQSHRVRYLSIRLNTGAPMTAAPERRSTRSFGEYAFLEDSRYGSQMKNISG
jgi:hypothetical protein